MTARLKHSRRRSWEAGASDASPFCSCCRRSLLVALFRIFPLVWGFVLSLTDASGVSQGNFIGLDNYRAIAADPTFRDSIENTLILIATLPAWVLLPLLLAILIHQGVPGGKVFRAVYFFPAVLSSVIVGSIFNVVLRFDGSLNALLKTVGLVPVDWLGNGPTALASLIAVQLWSTFGMSLLIFMAGLSTVSQELVEAATLEGAKPLADLALRHHSGACARSSSSSPSPRRSAC